MPISLIIAGRTVPGFNTLVDTLSRAFHSQISAQFEDFPFTRAYRNSRKQYDADILLAELSGGADPVWKIVFIIHEDIFSKPHDFVFGLAKGNAAVVSVTRLDPRFYGKITDMPKAGALFKERILKEAMHELGHLHGLPHCEDSSCVMAFSESIEAVDSKGKDFCPGCRAALHLE
ncbi:MAG: archaemetzincin family Zn-dependent metalloprotease [Candidatus Micrarchaeota archaeon]